MHAVRQLAFAQLVGKAFRRLALPLSVLRNRRRYVVAIGVVVVAAAGGGLAAALSLPATNAPNPFGVSPDKYVTNSIDRWPSTLVGKSPDEIVNTLVARYGGSDIVDASVTGPPAGFQPTDGSAPSPDTSNWKFAHFTVSVPCKCVAAHRALWEASLVSGALRDALHANGDYLYTADITLQLPDGSKVPINETACCGNIVYDQQFDTPSMSDIPTTIRQAAEGTALTIDSIDVLQADQPAPAVVATTDGDPKTVLQEAGQLTNQLFGNPPRYEGYYLEVRDTSGNPIFIQYTSFRAGVGTQSVQPALMCSRAGPIPYNCGEYQSAG